MIPMTVAEIARAAGGEVIREGSRPGARLKGVSTDSRSVRKGEVFVALRGKRNDGHDFLGQALQRGAAAVVVSRLSPGDLRKAAGAGAAVIRVRDTVTALTRLAARQREMTSARVVAITGSTGKTITKDLTASVLGQAGPVVYPRSSFNNEIGLPLTVLDLKPETRFLVLEMGSRGRGHIESLCRVARPEVGVITNIGCAHLRFFRTRDNLAAAKGELLQALPSRGFAVINADDDYRDFLARLAPCPVVTFGLSRRADVRAERIRLDGEGRASFLLRTKGGGKEEVTVPLPGRHNVENALAAAAVGEIMGVKMESIATGIAEARMTGWRMEMITKPDEITIINDAYNANPVSMRSALMALGDIARGKRSIAVLGDMAELGPVSEEAHLEVGRMVVDYGTDILITVGRKARKIAQAAREKGLPRGSVFSVDGVDKAAEILRAIIEPGDVVLIKGSRFLGLERLTQLVA